MIEAEKIKSPMDMIYVIALVDEYSDEKLIEEIPIAEDAFLQSEVGTHAYRYYNWYANLLTLNLLERSGIAYL